MQQGESNAPATIQNIMNNLYKHELEISLYIYIDYIFIFRKTYKEHLYHITTVL